MAGLGRQSNQLGEKKANANGERGQRNASSRGNNQDESSSPKEGHRRGSPIPPGKAKNT